MKNIVQTPGRIVALTAPAGGVVAGRGYLIGGLFVVALSTALAGVVTQFIYRDCVIEHAKNVTQAMTEGVAVYWDNVAFNLTTTISTNKLVGYCVNPGGRLAADATALVTLSGA